MPEEIKSKLKMRMFEAVIIPTLLFDSEDLAPLSTHVKTLQSFVIRGLRVIVDFSR